MHPSTNNNTNNNPSKTLMLVMVCWKNGHFFEWEAVVTQEPVQDYPGTVIFHGQQVRWIKWNPAL